MSSKAMVKAEQRVAPAVMQPLGPTLRAPTASHELGETPARSGFGHDFGQIRVQPKAQAVHPGMESCPLNLGTPRNCPFGGACHTCPPRIQAKLTIGQPNDKYEQEADRIADQVMAMPDPSPPAIQRTCPDCEEEIQRQVEPEEEEEEEVLQTKPLTGQLAPLIQRQAESEEEEDEIVLQAKSRLSTSPQVSGGLSAQIQRAVRSGGQPLAPALRRQFEPRFGYDLSQVRVHSDNRAAEAARNVSARAFTLGRHVVFGRGQYEPGTTAGQRLIAHELTHVLQQSARSATASSSSIQTTPLPVAHGFVQRAVTYSGARVQQDIDPLDPSTAPAGNQQALGHTAMLVNGTDVQSLSSPEDKINLLFPLPSFAPVMGMCFVTNKTLNLNVQNRMRVLTRGPWSRTIAKSQLNTLFGGALGRPAACSGGGNTTVSVRGAPTDLDLRAWVMQGEGQHARDDQCLVDRHLKSYEAAVQALPDEFPRGYLGFGSCAARLDERLRRRERAIAFLRDWRDWTQTYDGPGGSHQIVARPSIGSGCSTVTLTVSTSPLPYANRVCSRWSPP